MKKLVFLAVLAITVASCKKEQAMQPQNPAAQAQSMEEQVANVIKQADAKLYNKVYGTQADAKAPKEDVRFLPGVFYIPGPGPSGGIDNATCLGTNNVCMVIVTSPKSETGNISAITGNVNETFDSTVSNLILNTGDAPTSMPLSHLEVTTENGISVKFN